MLLQHNLILSNFVCCTDISYISRISYKTLLSHSNPKKRPFPVTCL